MRITRRLPLNLGSSLSRWCLGAFVALGLVTSSFANATTYNTQYNAQYNTHAKSFSGFPIGMKTSHSRNPGHLVITLQGKHGGSLGDLRGLFTHVADGWLIPGHSALGRHGGGGGFDDHEWSHPGDGDHSGSGSGGKDWGDLQEVWFKISHLSHHINVKQFKNHDFRGHGWDGGSSHHNRHGHGGWNKPEPVPCEVVPEPSTALLMAFGLAGLSVVARKSGVVPV